MATTNKFIITVPSEVLYMTNSTQFKVYATIRSFAENGDGVCFASKTEISIRAKVNEKTVYKNIEILKKKGFIKSIGRKIRSVGGKPVEHIIIIDSNRGVSGQKGVTKKIRELPTTEEQPTKRELPVTPKKPLSNSILTQHKAEKESRKESKPVFEKKNEHEKLPPILAYVHEKVLPFRKNIANKKVYAEKVASNIAVKLLAKKESLLHPTENKNKAVAFKARAELGLEPQCGLKNRLKPEWSEADKLWFAINHSYGWEHLKEKGII